MNDAPRFSRPSISMSIRPSGFFNIELPYGDPPAALCEQSRPGRLQDELRRTVRALSNNAEKIRPRSPLMAAQCWHEAGRLLDRRAGRYKDAWVCYSRALAVFPDHRPSLIALSALAKRARVDDVTGMLLDALVDRSASSAEKAALLTEAASVCIKTGDLTAARKKLSTAIGLSKTSLVPRVLLAAIAASATEDKDVWKHVAPLHDATRPSLIASGLVRYAAVRADRLVAEGVVSDGGTNEAPVPPPEEVSLSLRWIRLRTLLRQGRTRDAAKLLNEMAVKLPEGMLQRALSRFRNTLERISSVEKPVAAPMASDVTENDAFYALMNAQLCGDKEGGKRWAAKLRREVGASELKNALALYQMVCGRQGGEPNRFSFGPAGISSPAAQAVYRFLQESSPPDTRDPEADAAALYLAVQDPARMSSVLGRLRNETLDMEAEWPMKVAETALELGQIDPPKREPQNQVLADEETHRSPLPSIMRRTERRHRRLAELCLGEARNSEDPKFVASRLAWAAYHLETLDPFDSARLYTEALSCDPSLLFAVKGLERIGTNGREAATLYQCAAEAAVDKDVRVEALLRAGILFAASRSPAEAAPIFGEAATLLPGDEGLQRIAFRSALTYPKRVHKNHVAALLDGKAAGVPPFLAGTFFLFLKPEAAAERFEAALSDQPDDSAASLGLTEALLRAGRASIVSERLFLNLRKARDVFEEAVIYQRLAHIDRFHRDDNISALHFAESLFSRLPGHRPTLVRLMLHYMFQRQSEDLRRTLTALSLTVSDDGDAAAISRLCTLSDPTKTDLLRWVSGHADATLLELTALECLTEDPAERLSLLEKITARMPQSTAYLSRLADATAAAGRLSDAVPFYKQSLEGRLTVFYGLQNLAEILCEMATDGMTLDTMVNAADAWTTGSFRARALHRAAQFASEKTGDFEKAVDLSLLAIHADPEDTDAFSLADNLLTTVVHNPVLYLQLLETRLKGYLDPVDEIVIRMKIRSLIDLVEKETGAAKRQAHLKAAVALVSDNRPPSGEEDEEGYAAVWDDAVYKAVIGARLNDGALTDAPLFSDLGRMYLYKLKDAFHAEMYFEEALRIDPDLPEALSGYADILLGRGENAAASEYLGRLTGSALASEEKLEKLLINAEILKADLHDEKEAELVLKEAWKTAPSALGPVTALADIYEARGDGVTLSVHLSTALQTYRTALADAPDDRRLYENIHHTALRKHELITADAAADMEAYLRDDSAHVPKAQWTLHSRRNFADPSLDEQLCPQAVSAGLRNVLRTLETPLSRMLGVAADQVDIAGLEKSKRRDSVAAVAAKLRPMFGVGELEIRMGTTGDLRIAPGLAPVILMPRAVFQSESLGVKRFAAAAAFQWLRLGLALTTTVPAVRIRRMLAGLGRLYIADFTTPEFTDEQTGREAAGIEAAVSKSVLDSLSPFVSDIRAALSDAHFEKEAATAGHRAGLIAAGSLPMATAGLRAVSGGGEGALLLLPGAGWMISFALSSDFAEIIKGFESE